MKKFLKVTTPALMGLALFLSAGAAHAKEGAKKVAASPGLV